MDSELFSFNPVLAWFVAGVAFMALEALTPGFFMLFFGLGAWSAAACALTGFLSLTEQFVVFIGVALAGLLVFRKKLKLFWSDRPPRNEVLDDPVTAEQYLGQTAVVIREIKPGRLGLVELHGVNWNARCETETLRPEETVVVRGREGLTLAVEKFADRPASAAEPEV